MQMLGVMGNWRFAEQTSIRPESCDFLVWNSTIGPVEEQVMTLNLNPDPEGV